MSRPRSNPKAKKDVKARRKTDPAPAVPPETPAVDELVALWRSTREPRVAEVLDGIAKLAPPAASPTTKRGHEAKWRAWAARFSTSDLPALLAATPSDRVDVFDRFGPDPRIGRALVDLIVSARPWSAADRTQAHIVAMFERLATHADVEVVDRLARLVRINVRNTGYVTSSEWFDREAPKVVERLRAEVPASTAEPALLDRCRRWLAALSAPESPHAELVAAVYENPDDDDARAVLADALQQHAPSPHGELIALQLAPPTPTIDKRIGSLLRKSAGECCAPVVWRALRRGSARFERGFIAGGKLAPHSERDFTAAIGAIDWATVHTLAPSNFAGFGSSSTDRQRTLELLAHPAMKHLRRVGPLEVQELAVLLAYGVPLPWRSIAVTADDNELELPASDVARVFPHLACVLLDVPTKLRGRLDTLAWLHDVEVRYASEPVGLDELFGLPR